MKHIMGMSIIVALMFGLPAFAEQALVKSSGVITEKHAFGEVVINGKQYVIDTMCEILDDKGESLSLGSLELQSRIIFEYENDHSRAFPVIKRMKVLPQ